jgi:hypothetical protein
MFLNILPDIRYRGNLAVPQPQNPKWYQKSLGRRRPKRATLELIPFKTRMWQMDDRELRSLWAVSQSKIQNGMAMRARSSVDRAPDSGSGCRGFKSLRARFVIPTAAMRSSVGCRTRISVRLKLRNSAFYPTRLSGKLRST